MPSTTRKRTRSLDTEEESVELAVDRRRKFVATQAKILTICEKAESNLTNLKKMRKDSEKHIAMLEKNKSFTLITLNVGGQLFSIPETTLSHSGQKSYFQSLLLCRDDSLLTLQTDENGNIYIDRDPDVFHYILDYLRGYKKFDKVDGTLAKKLRVDAEFYRLPDLLQLLEEKKKLYFQPGPGVSQDGERIRVTFGVALVDHEMVTGKHEISFKILADEYVGIGIVSENCRNTDFEFHKTPNCCVYYMSGVFYSNYPYHRKEAALAAESITRYGNGDQMDIRVDMDKGIAEFTIKKLTKIISLGKAKRLRFAVITKFHSTVVIV